MTKLIGFGVAALVALIVAGIILGGYSDATGSSSIPGLTWLTRLPKVLRILIKLVIGVPIAFGIALYVIFDTVDLLSFLTAPIRKLSRRPRRS